MKITKKHLTIIKGCSFSYDDFCGLNRSGFNKESFEIKLGHWTIAKIVQGDNNKYYLSGTYMPFKSKETAIRGLLERINKRLYKKI